MAHLSARISLLALTGLLAFWLASMHMSGAVPQLRRSDPSKGEFLRDYMGTWTATGYRLHLRADGTYERTTQGFTRPTGCLSIDISESATGRWTYTAGRIRLEGSYEDNLWVSSDRLVDLGIPDSVVLERTL